MDPITRLSALGAAGAGGGNTYFFDRIRYGSSGTNYAAIQGNYVDSDGNLYDVGYIVDLTNTIGFVIKRDAEGVIQWSRTLSSTGKNVQFYDVASDGTYLYCVGSQDINNSTGGCLVVVYDFNGTLQWQKEFHASSTSVGAFSNYIAVDSSSNIFLSVREASTYTPVGVIKLNSSGVVQWGKGYYYAPSPVYNYNERYDICIDSNDNILVNLRIHSGTSLRTSAGLVKLNNSGTLQWDLVFFSNYGFPNFDYGFGVDTDSNDNIYWGLNYDANGHYIAKFNSSGVLQSNIEVGTGSVYPKTYVDYEDNVWTTGQGFLQSFDTSLSNNFSRKFGSGGQLYYGKPFRGSGSDGIYVSNKNNNIASYRGYTFYLPADGSLTGTYVSPTYGTFNYEAYSETIGAGTSYVDLGSLTEITWSPVATTTTNTDASDTFTNEPFFIG